MSAVIICYLAVGAFCSLTTLLHSGDRLFRAADRTVDQLLGLTTLHMQRRGLLRRAQWELRRVLVLPMVLVGWPGPLTLSLPHLRKPFRERMARGQLSPSALAPASGYFGFGSLLLVARASSGPHWSTDVGATALLVAILAITVTGILTSEDLPSQLRRHRMHPYLQFVATAALLYATLAICAMLVGDDGAAVTVDRQFVGQQILSLTAFGHPIDAMRKLSGDPTSIMMTITGVAYFAILLKLVFQYKQFARQPADHSQLILRMLELGEVAAAQRRYDRLARTVKNEAVMLAPRVALALLHGRFDRALALARTATEQQSENDTLLARYTDDDLLTQVFASARWAMLDASRSRELLTFARERHVSDALLCRLVWGAEDFHLTGASDLSELGFTEEDFPLSTNVLRWRTAPAGSAAEKRAGDQIMAAAACSPAARVSKQLTLMNIDVLEGGTPVAKVEQLLGVVETEAMMLPPWSKVDAMMTLDMLTRENLLGDDTALASRVESVHRQLRAEASDDELADLEAVALASSRLR